MLVILGLLVGGVLSGQSLIRAAELRAAATEYSRYVTSTQTFRDKYFALPGDMPNATSFWTAEPLANCPGDQTTPSTTKATCNGNGDGQITFGGAAGFGGESHRFWQHLSNAALIEGNYTGTHSAGGCNGDGSCNVTLGANAPKSRVSNAGWVAIYGGGAITGNVQVFDGNYPNNLYFGALGNYTSAGALSPEEAWNVDTKTDDGKPTIGNVVAWKSAINPGCTTADTTGADWVYTTKSKVCALIFRNAF